MEEIHTGVAVADDAFDQDISEQSLMSEVHHHLYSSIGSKLLEQISEIGGVAGIEYEFRTEEDDDETRYFADVYVTATDYDSQGDEVLEILNEVPAPDREDTLDAANDHLHTSTGKELAEELHDHSTSGTFHVSFREFSEEDEMDTITQSLSVVLSEFEE